MFQRRVPLTPLQKIKEVLWPSMGWKRTFRYGQLRLIRLRDTTKSIAIGLSFGASVSFTPLPGAHIISAAALTMLAGGNVLASVGGTLIGNPWTFPLMWWAAYKVGDFAFRIFGGKVIAQPDNFVWADFVHEITAHPMELVVPWICGGLILMAFSWPVFYVISYRMVQNLRHTKKGRRQ